jgi:hypothetical protein
LRGFLPNASRLCIKHGYPCIRGAEIPAEYYNITDYSLFNPLVKHQRKCYNNIYKYYIYYYKYFLCRKQPFKITVICHTVILRSFSFCYYQQQCVIPGVNNQPRSFYIEGQFLHLNGENRWRKVSFDLNQLLRWEYIDFTYPDVNKSYFHFTFNTK